MFNGIIIDDEEDLSDRHFHKYQKWFAPEPSAEIVVCEAKNVGREYRVIVVDGVPVAASEYKLDMENPAPQNVYDFVSELSLIWNPTLVYVVDVAETDQGYKVVEYNQFGTSGVYGSNQIAIIDALEKLYDGRKD